MTPETEEKTLLGAGYQSVDNEETGTKTGATNDGVGGDTRHRTKITYFVMGVLCASFALFVGGGNGLVSQSLLSENELGVVVMTPVIDPKKMGGWGMEQDDYLKLFMILGEGKFATSESQTKDITEQISVLVGKYGENVVVEALQGIPAATGEMSISSTCVKINVGTPWFPIWVTVCV